MRVCHLWEIFWPVGIGGVERYILSLTKYLNHNYGVESSLLTGRSKILSITKNIKKFEEASYLKIYRLGPTPADLVNGFLFDVLGSTFELGEKIRFASLCHEAVRSPVAKSADIFQVHGIWGGDDLEYVNLGVYLSQYYHKPLVVTLHGSLVGETSIGGMPLGKPAIKNVLVNYANAITTYSNEILGVLEKMGLGRKSYLIRNFVDTTQFTNPSPVKSGNTVVYVGRLEPPQTPEILIEAFKQVHARIPNARLRIVGYGSLYDRIKGLIHEYSLEETVSLIGKQTNVRKFLWQSDIFISTNFGYLASLEAWSAGLALIAPDFGVFKETVSNGTNGLLVKQHDADDLARALIILLENGQLRDKLALNAMEHVKSYDIRTVAPKFLRIYESALKNKLY